MKATDWSASIKALQGFGGEAVKLHVRKTGLPYYDALRLYGAIDLYVGVRQDVCIHDAGDQWVVEARRRAERIEGRDVSAYLGLRGGKRRKAEEFCTGLKLAVETAEPYQSGDIVKARGEWDRALQDGVRGIAAQEYETLRSGQTSRPECKAELPLEDAILALAGAKRVETTGVIKFLPVFEGPIDLAKVVSPLNAWRRIPNVLCAQSLTLLTLKTSLFAEGYEGRLSAVVFTTNQPGNRSDKYSGIISVASTAIGKLHTPELVDHLYHCLLKLIAVGWEWSGRKPHSTDMTLDALAMGNWVMQPVGKHLSGLVTSQERMRLKALSPIIFTRLDYVKEVFDMSYGNWQGHHEAVRTFARAVESGIYYARMMKEADPERRAKAWYDEIVMLRSAPSPKAFFERAMILIEQGHRENSSVGTGRQEAPDPQALFASIGNDLRSFETFRDLFRMYLVQASTGRQTTVVVPQDDAGDTSQTEEEEA